MKTRITFLLLLSVLSTMISKLDAQQITVSTELKDLIVLSLNKDRKVAEKDIDKQIAEVQQKAIRSSFIPKLELGGKYLYAGSSINSEIGEVEGLESIQKLQELMKNPAFPAMFPTLGSLTGELAQLEQLMVQQGMQLPQMSGNLDGDFSGNYYGVDLTARMLLFSGGQVPNLSRALGEKIKAQDALSDKCKADVIKEVITCYDQLALLNQSKHVLDGSVSRLAAEKKFAASALKNGMATAFDTLRIEVANANLEAKLSEYENRKTLLYQKLSQLTGKPATSFESMEPVLELLLYASTGSDISKRAELRALTAGAEAQKYLLKSEKSYYLPKIQAIASIRYDNIFNARADFNAPVPMNMQIENIGLGPTYMIGAGFKWELFDRSGGSARVRQTMLELRKAENARDEAHELLELNETKAETNYRASLTQVNYRDKQRVAARSALELAQKSYNEGMINITERLATETELQNSELEYLQSVFVERQSVLECYNSTGDLILSNIR